MPESIKCISPVDGSTYASRPVASKKDMEAAFTRAHAAQNKWKRLPLAELPPYVERVGLHRDFNRLYFGLSPEAFAEWLVVELERSGAVRREGELLVPG